MLTVTEAHAVNTLLDHLLRRARPGADAPSSADAAAAAKLLAEHATKALQAGIGPADIPDALPGWTLGAAEFARAYNAGQLTVNQLWARLIMDCPDPKDAHGHCSDSGCDNWAQVCPWHHETDGPCTRTVAAASIVVDVLALLGIKAALSQHTGTGA